MSPFPINFEYKESAPISGKDTIFGRICGVQVVLPSEPEDYIVDHSCGFRIRGGNHLYRTGSVPKLDWASLVCGFPLPCHSRWKCALDLEHTPQDHVASGWDG